MKPHPRIRKFFKWGGLVVSVLLLVVWVGSAYGWFCYSVRRGYVLDVVRGQFTYMPFQTKSPFRKTRTEWMRASPTGFNWSAKYERTEYSWYVVVPLWPFVAISIATTATAWRMDTLAQRRKRLGACPACGYDRTGLAANAPCPECNAKA